MNRTHRSFLLLVLAACEGGFNRNDGQVKVVDPDVVEQDTPTIQPHDVTGDSPAAPTCDTGRAYVGFGGLDLALDREPGAVGEETRRPRPFTALASEFTRVLGATPTMLAGAESTYGTIPARWSQEPTLSAVSVFTTFRIAFQGCLTLTAQPAKFGVMPTEATARTECAAWAERFWSRTALGPELDACVQVVTRDATVETNARRRWAYGCAATLSSADFLTF
jgi:hypothetical protein